MLYFLGFLGFFQITFLPGFFTLKYLQIRTKTALEKIIFIFTLSLITNFILVFILSLIKLYLPFVIYAIFFIEMVAFFFTIKNNPIYFRLDLPKRSKKIFTLIFFLSIVVIARFLLPFLQNFSLDSVFLQGDAIDSWNFWSTTWAKNIIPSKTLHYPQLIPANWSLTYIFMQTTTVELFAKLMMPLFVLAILFIFFDLGDFVGLISTGIFFHYYFDNLFLRDGYVDLAFSFFAFLPFYCLILYKKYENKQYLLLMILFALGSFLTKQLGIYILLLAFIYSWKKIKNKGFTKMKLVIAVVFVTTFFWYLLKVPEIKNNHNIESVYQTAMASKISSFSMPARLSQSLKILAPNIKGIFILIIVVLSILLSFKNKQSRQLLGLIVLPFFVLWSMFLNYDQRNLSVIFPYLGYIISRSVTTNRLIVTKRFKFHPLKISFVLFFILIFVSTFIPDHKLLFYQTEGKKKIGIPELNLRLYDYHHKYGFKGKISTSYFRLCNLPEIGKYCLYQQNKVVPAEYYLYPKEVLKNRLNECQIIFEYRDWVLKGCQNNLFLNF